MGGSGAGTTVSTGGAGGVGGTGGSGGVGGTGGGGTMYMGPDTCPGEPITMGLGFSGAFPGDTTNANGDYDSVCDVGMSGPDEVYQLDITQPGTLSMAAVPLGDQDLSVYLRSVCDDGASAVWCADQGAGGATEVRNVHVDAGTHFLVVDTFGSTGGPYQLNLALAAPVCGDGVVNPGEQCDDGNNATGDGCDGCMFEPGVHDDCSDPEVQLVAGTMGGHVTFSGNNFGNSATYGFDDGPCGVTEVPPGGFDRVMQLIPQISGEMTLRLGWDATNTDPPYCNQAPDFFNNVACLESVIHVRHSPGNSGVAVCGNQGNQIACAGSQATPYLTNEVTFDVTAGESYYVFIDSYYNGGSFPNFVAGPYDLNVSLEPNGGTGGAGGAGGAGGN